MRHGFAPHAWCPKCREVIEVVTVPGRAGEFYGRHRRTVCGVNGPCPNQMRPAPSSAIVAWAAERAKVALHDALALAAVTSRPEFYGPIARQCMAEARWCIQQVRRRVDPAPLMVTRSRHAR